MADIAPFRALRYDARVVPDLRAVVAPPYDVITPEARQRYARHPFNVVRLTLPETDDPGPAVGDRYQRAARTFAAWRAQGVLQRDPEPAVYPYEQEFSLGEASRRRRGFLALVRLAEYEEKQILPHERTFARYKDDRLRLMRACPADLEAILGFYDAPGVPVAAILDEGMASAPLVSLTDEEGVGQRLWRLRGPAVSELAARLADCPVTIADGHHRYETALAFRNERLAGVSEAEARRRPEAFVLMHLVHARDPGLVILPTHRLIRRAATLAALRPLLARHFDLAAVPARASDRLPALRAALADLQRERAAGVGFVAVGVEEMLRLRLRDQRAGEELRAAGQSPALAGLDVAILHAVVIEGILGLQPGDPDAVGYERDEAKVVAAVAAGHAPIAFCLPAPGPLEVLALALARERMPQKSTFFYPKVLSGLAMHPIDPGDRVGR